jgi:CheY-like chemotaxis protein
MRILVVDDNAVQGEALADYLGSRGHEAAWAPCLVGALAHLRRRRYDVALVDMVLPCCGPGELVRGLLAAPRPPALVALTGLAPGDPALEVLPPGTPVLHKPADPEDVVRTLESLAAGVTAEGGAAC